MSAKTEKILSVEYVTDHDCGNYKIGEIDFAISVGELDRFLKNYGYEGKKDLVAKLGYLIYHVENEFRSLPDSQASQCASGG